MATDARGHTAPAAGETPKRDAINALSLSINDFIIATNATDKATKLAAIGPTASRPAFVWQTDIGVATVETGTTSTVIAPPEVTGSGSMTTSGTETVVTGCSLSLPAGTWDVSAKCYADWAVASGSPRYYLRLRNTSVSGTLLDETQVYIGTLGGSVPMTAEAYRVVLSAADTVMLTAYSTNSTGGSTVVQQAKIRAVRVA